MEVLAAEPRVVLCDLDGLASAGSAVEQLFAPVTDYLRLWPGTVVVALARDPSLRTRLSPATPEHLLVRGSRATGVAEAKAMVPDVRRRELVLAPRAVAVKDARAFAARTLGDDWHLCEVVAPAVLAVSELVTNSVVHAVTVLQLTLSVVEGRVRLAVRDRGGGAPRARHEERLEEQGRGLQVVHAMTRGWGVFPSRAAGKTVWAVLDTSTAADAA
jgi:hypothetical protein